jgi:hypothetical protein
MFILGNGRSNTARTKTTKPALQKFKVALDATNLRLIAG